MLNSDFVLQGCMELIGKYDKGGSHEELCRGHPAGKSSQGKLKLKRGNQYA